MMNSNWRFMVLLFLVFVLLRWTSELKSRSCSHLMLLRWISSGSKIVKCRLIQSLYLIPTATSTLWEFVPQLQSTRADKLDHMG